MGKFERENISKKVKLVSQVFAILASCGILIIGLQLFSKTTGFDIFNINYSLAKLFSDEPKPENNVPSTLSDFKQPVLKPSITAPFNNEAQLKAASLLQNHITLLPIKPSPSAISSKCSNEQKNTKFSLITISSLHASSNLFNLSMESLYSKNLNQNGILRQVKEAKLSKWSIGISLSPGISYRQLKYTNLDEIITRRVGNTQYGFYQTQKERNERDKALMKFSFGLDLIYRFNKKLSVQSGLVYLSTGESLLVKEITDETNNQISLAGTGAENHYFFEGKPDFESPKEENPDENVRFANHISYFEIPLTFNYQMKSVNELTNIELQAGASITRLNFVTAMVYNFDNDGYYLISGSNPAVFQKYGSNAMFGIMYNKYITNTIQLFANPQLKVGLTNVFNSDYNIKQHYYSAGVRLGMKINL